MEKIEVIWQLQCLENELLELEKNSGMTDSKRKIQNLSQTYNHLCHVMKQKAVVYKAKEKDLIRDNMKVKELNLKIDLTKNKLYNGDTKKVKVINQMEKDLKNMEEQVEKHQELIEVIKAENYQMLVELKKLKINAKKIKMNIENFKINYAEQKETIKTNTEEILSRIEILKNNSDSAIVEEYYNAKERIYPVIVELKNNVCEGCKMQLSMIMNQKVHSNSHNEFRCESCGRLIYITEDEEVTAAE